jgi:hypothetical protein
LLRPRTVKPSQSDSVANVLSKFERMARSSGPQSPSACPTHLLFRLYTPPSKTVRSFSGKRIQCLYANQPPQITNTIHPATRLHSIIPRGFPPCIRVTHAARYPLSGKIEHPMRFPLERGTGFDPSSRHHTLRNLSETFPWVIVSHVKSGQVSRRETLLLRSTRLAPQ